jgi:hypothetical protein
MSSVSTDFFNYQTISHPFHLKFISKLAVLFSNIILENPQQQFEFPKTQYFDPFIFYTLCICNLIYRKHDENIIDESYINVLEKYKSSLIQKSPSKSINQMISLMNQASNLIQSISSYYIYAKLKLPIPKSPSLGIYDFAIMINVIPDI